MTEEMQRLCREIGDRAAKAIAKSGRILGLNDQAVVETVIRPYFTDSPLTGRRRHLIDVGAAYGNVAELFLKDGWTADLFEPDPSCEQALNRLKFTYGATVRLFPAAVSDQDAPLASFHQNAIPGLSGLSPSPFGITLRQLPIQTVRLQTFLAMNNVASVDFLKIDTEGNDFAVLKSFDFQRTRPAIIYLEYNYYFPQHNEKVLGVEIAAMQAHGYTAIIFEYNDDGNFKRGNWNHRLVAIHTDGQRIPARNQAFGNVLFCRSDDCRLLNTLLTLVHHLS